MFNFEHIYVCACVKANARNFYDRYPCIKFRKRRVCYACNFGRWQHEAPQNEKRSF